MNGNAIEDIYELSPLQQGMLFHSLSGTDPEMYVAQRSYRLHGALDHEALGKAWRDVMARHPALRTSFHWDDLDKPLQVVHGDASVELDVLDWRGLGEDEQRERLRRCLADDRGAGFDLTAAPLMRLTLVRLGEERYQFVWTHHMILLDGWSVPLVVQEIFLRYAELTGAHPGRGAAGLPAPPYCDYIAWLQRQDEGAAERFWRAALGGVVLQAPLTRPPRPASPPTVAAEEVRLSGRVTAGLRALAARHRVTLNTVLQAAWALLLARHAGAPEVVFGITTAGRPAGLPRVEDMVGLFINTLPLRVPVPAGPVPVGDWLRDIHQRQAAALEYEYSVLPRIRRWAGLPGGRPLFDSVVVFESYPVPVDVRHAVGALSIATDSSVERTSEPLTVVASVEPDLTIRLLYQVERFEPGLVPALAKQIRTALEHLAERPDGVVEDIPLLREDEYRALVPAWQGPVRTYPGAPTLHELVSEQVRRTPDAVAVQAEGERVTYAELDARAQRLATALRARGAGPGTPVAVCGERCVPLVVSLLAVLKAGAAYLPLDPGLPAERVALVLGDAGAALVVSDRPLPTGTPVLPMTGPWPAPGPGHPAPRATVPAGTAYVIYTSGSTGTPKGAPVPHGAIRNRLLWMQEVFGLTPDDRVLQKTPFDFDVSVWEFFWPLMTGARLVLARPGGHRDPAYLVRTVAGEGITTMHFVPSMLAHYLDEPGAAAPTRLRRLFCSGEALPATLRDRFLAALPSVELHNLYGPTEATVDVTWWDCRRDGPPGVVPIGTPVANTQIHVLDRRLRPLPVGVPGELCIGGIQVAPGYLNRPELTRSAFPPDPFAASGAPLYRTGDLARRLPDGAIEFLGRLDHQIKVRGFRVEPGEIEHALLRHPRVSAAAVHSRGDVGDVRLVGYVVATDPRPTAAELRAHLTARLPAHMVPSAFVALDALPLTANGKLNRAALPAPDSGAAPVPAGVEAPRTELEARVAGVFGRVLGIERVGVEQDFFDLGGDSFQAIRAVRDLPGASVALLFQHPTARALADALTTRPDRTADGILLPLTPRRGAADRTLVCVPYGGGHAIAYLPLARQVPEDTAVYAVRLPGHDVGASEPLRPLADVAADAAREILDTVDGPIALYGHCIGVALAVEVAHRLESAGRTVDRVFLGGSFPFPTRQVLGVNLLKLVPFRRRESDEQVLRYLQSLGGFGDVIEEDELRAVMSAFRHDGMCAGRWFTQRYAERDTARLSAPITFVAGDADPETRHYERRYREWRRFSDSVDLAVIPGGGHYFVKHHAEQLAGIIRRMWT